MIFLKKDWKETVDIGNLVTSTNGDRKSWNLSE